MKRLPSHIGIIPDGNRRWASGHGMEKGEGYAHGVDPGLSLLERMMELGIREATIYGFTRDNNKRAKNQRDAFTQACVKVAGLLRDRDVNLLVIGNTESSAFPEELLPYANERVSFGSGRMNLNFLINYDWEWDLKTAITTGKIASALIPRVDLLIRWGGHRRLSGFLPVQSVYADIFVVDDYWPDYKDKHFFDAIDWYQDCDVTLGG